MLALALAMALAMVMAMVMALALAMVMAMALRFIKEGCLIPLNSGRNHNATMLPNFMKPLSVWVNQGSGAIGSMVKQVL